MTRSAQTDHAVSPQAPPAERRQALLKKAAVHLFVALHLAAVIYWSFTSPLSTAPLDRRIRHRVGRYVQPAGLAQQWIMFVNPPLSNNYLEAEVTFADGGRATWQFPRVNQMGLFERYRKERYRKWAVEYVLAAGKPAPVIAEAAARFAARQVERPGNAPRKVELVRYRSQTPPPGRGQMRPYAEPPRDWDRQNLYTCEFDDGGRITRSWASTQPIATQPTATQPAEKPPTTSEPSPELLEGCTSRDGVER